MTERPILFSGEMVRAILEGRKTQTRRVLNPQPDDDCCWEGIEGVGYVPSIFVPEKEDDLPARFRYGKIGEHLWAREAFLPDPPQNGDWDYYSYTDGILHNFKAIPEKYRIPEFVLYKASWTGTGISWLPSIHMPRWASRITLKITQVRVERVQEITEEDAKAEGVIAHPDVVLNVAPDGYRTSFHHTWTVINAKRSFGWDTNPWVWAITFKRIKP